MKNSPNNSQELRNQLQTLVEARQSLEKNQDISGSMVRITHALNKVKPMMTKQGEYIKNFLQGNQANDQSSKQSQNRRYISRISDIVLNDVNEIIVVAQKYFTIELKTTWTKIRNQFEKNLHSEKQQIDKNNLVEFLFKAMNMKEKLMKQFLKSVVYRKCLLWKDLNIVNEGFVHCEKKKITKSIEDYIAGKKYAPTRPVFSLPSFDTPGQWNLSKLQYEDSSTAQFLKLINQQLEETFSIVRNYSNLTAQQRSNEDIKRNDGQVRSLRQQIQMLNINYQLLEKKYREAVSKDQKLDIVEMKEKLKIAEDALQSKDLELRQLRYSYRDYSRDMITQKQKVKQLEADLQKITNQQMKKLKQVEMLQIALTEEFSRLHKNMSSFGTMFQFESEGKKSLAKEIMNLKEKIEKMAIILGRHKNQNNLQKQEIKRLNIIIIELGNKLRQSKT